MNAFVILLVAVVCVMTFLASCHKIFQRIWCALNCSPFPRNQVQIRRFSEAAFEDPSLQFQSHGLESSVMQSLPTTQYKEDKEEQRPRNNECAICLGEFEEGEWLKHLPNCAHFFHIACIDAWFQTHSNCPLCRSLVYDRSLYRDCSISMHSLLETLNREDFLHERAANDQVVRSEILQSPALRPEETGGVRQPGFYLQSIWTA